MSCSGNNIQLDCSWHLPDINFNSSLKQEEINWKSPHSQDLEPPTGSRLREMGPLQTIQAWNQLGVRDNYGWLVVALSLWKIWKSIGMMKFPIYGKIWKNKKWSKPPTRWRTSGTLELRELWQFQDSRRSPQSQHPCPGLQVSGPHRDGWLLIRLKVPRSSNELFQHDSKENTQSINMKLHIRYNSTYKSIRFYKEGRKPMRFLSTRVWSVHQVTGCQSRLADGFKGSWKSVRSRGVFVLL